MKLFISALALVATVACTAFAQSTAIDWDKVDAGLGRKSSVASGVHRYAFPRADLSVSLDGVAVKPALALGGWVAFKPALGGGAMVMGDLVLLEAEVNPVMQKLIDGGIDVTAIHNHLLRSNPETIYLHVGGRGDPLKMAETLHDALALTKTPLTMPPETDVAPITGIDTAQLDEIIGAKGEAKGGIYQLVLARREPVFENGMDLTPAGALGIATTINFQPTGDGKAAIAGDLVLTGAEVNPVMKTLRENGIEITAVHSHMLDEEPRLFFMHFWANDDALKLARGLRAAFDKTNRIKS